MPFDCRMEVIESFRKTIEPIVHEAQKVKRLGVLGRKLKGLSIGLLSFKKTTGLLMGPSLIEAPINGCSAGPELFPAFSILTASLCSIHDASPDVRAQPTR